MGEVTTLDKLNAELAKSILGSSLGALTCNGPVILWPDGRIVPLDRASAAIELAKLDEQKEKEKLFRWDEKTKHWVRKRGKK